MFTGKLFFWSLGGLGEYTQGLGYGIQGLGFRVKGLVLGINRYLHP